MKIVKKIDTNSNTILYRYTYPDIFHRQTERSFNASNKTSCSNRRKTNEKKNL